MEKEKAKEIIESFYDFIYQPGMSDNWIDKWLESDQAAALLSGEDWKDDGWINFEDKRPEDLEIVAVLDENGESDFGVYQSRWDWVSCVNERTLKPVYYFPLPEPPKP